MLSENPYRAPQQEGGSAEPASPPVYSNFGTVSLVIAFVGLAGATFLIALARWYCDETWQGDRQRLLFWAGVSTVPLAVLGILGIYCGTKANRVGRVPNRSAEAGIMLNSLLVIFFGCVLVAASLLLAIHHWLDFAGLDRILSTNTPWAESLDGTPQSLSCAGESGRCR